MTRRVTLACLLTAIAASVAGFPFEPAGAHDWAGLFFVVWALAVFGAASLMGIHAGRHGGDLTAAGFAAVAMYGFGTALNSSLLARGLLGASVGIQPGVWGMLALGLLLIGAGRRFRPWVRAVGVASAIGHAVASAAVLFGAEMPHTGAEASDWPALVVAVSKLLLWVTMAGWIVDVWNAPVPGEPMEDLDHEAAGREQVVP